MPLSRRQWLLWSSAACTSGALSACTTAPSHSNAEQPITAGAGANFYRLPLGKGHVIAISDGVMRRPLDAGFVRNAPLEAVQAALAAQSLPTTHIDMPYTCFVLEHEGKRYLLDTGFADNGSPHTGHLHHSMQAAGVDPDSIDSVIISHMHGDHINGLRRKDGTLVYPKAKVWVPAGEFHHWMSEQHMQRAPEGARGSFVNARRVFHGYPKENLQLFTPGRQLAHGIYTEAAYGHSPGQAVISMVSGNERFTYLADVANYPALFVRNPDWQVQFDLHPEEARATRHKLLRQMAQSQSYVGGYHFPLPSLGHIQAAGAGHGYHWRPLA